MEKILANRIERQRRLLKALEQKIEQRRRKLERQSKQAQKRIERLGKRTKLIKQWLKRLEAKLRQRRTEFERASKQVKKIKAKRKHCSEQLRKLQLRLKTLVRKLREAEPPFKTREVLELRRKVYERLKKLKLAPIEIRHVMSKEVRCLQPEQSLRDAVELFAKHRISGAPVIKEGKVVGVLSESDILKLVGADRVIDAKDAQALERTKVADAMSREVLFVRPEDGLEVAVAFMNKAHVNRLPVVDKQGKLVGIIAREDVLKGMMEVLFVQSMQRMPEFIQTEVDQMLFLLKRGPLSADELAEKLKVELTKLEEWIRMLEHTGIIEVSYTPTGKPVVRLRA